MAAPFRPLTVRSTPPKPFLEYIGAESNIIRFEDVPINPNVPFYFIVSFAVDHFQTSDGLISTPSNGKFHPFWNTTNLSPTEIAIIKNVNPNVKVILSIGGDVQGHRVNFEPTSEATWIANAVSSLGDLIKEYGFDGIEINYQHFSAGIGTFVDCIGQLITRLHAANNSTKFYISPSNNTRSDQRHYQALYQRCHEYIDSVNFQFFTYPLITNADDFIQNYFNDQSANYPDGRVLLSIITNWTGGIADGTVFDEVVRQLRDQRKLHGIVAWSADISKAKGGDDDNPTGFDVEERAQDLLANGTPNN